MFDIQIQDHGTIWVISGVTPEGRDWLEANLDPKAQRWRGGFAVDRRYAVAIIEGAFGAGLEIDTLGRRANAYLTRYGNLTGFRP